MGDIQSEVEIVKDAELGIDAIDLAGPQARIVVPCRAPLRYLIAHIKDMGQFSTITVTVVDNQKRIRRLNFSSRTSHAKIEQDAASLPLLLEDHAWNYLCLDLENMCHVAFGAPYAYCKEVCVTATCALGRLFFTDKKYEDVELPPFLRVLQ